jgi:hypothetical protein
MFNKEGDEYKSLEIGIGILLFIGIIFVILPPVKNNNKSKPAWSQEGFFSIFDIYNYRACCKSIELLLNWFDWFTEYLNEMSNYVVAKYEVDDEYIKDGKSGLQSVFLADLAIKVDSIPVDRIEEWF